MTFPRFAWVVLGYNVAVVLWGALVRATGSGAGCGGTWPLCNGDVLPDTAAATLIEFTHRVMSGLALVSVAALYIWARRANIARRPAFWALVLIGIEALLGAGLVVFGLTGDNRSAARPVYLAAHLANTQLLLGALAATVRFSRNPEPGPRPRSIAWALAVTLLISMTGAVAALGDTLFPAESLSAGVRADLHSESPALLRMRMLHPVVAVAGSLFLLWAVSGAAKLKLGPAAWAAFGLVMLQVIAGAVNIALLAPIWMQLVHLLIANLLWLSLVFLYLGVPVGQALRLRRTLPQSAATR